MNTSAAGFARVIVPSPLSQPLIYSVPEELRERVAVGMRVTIPLGKRTVTGVVLELLDSTSLTRTRPLTALLDDVPIMEGGLLFLIGWLAQYYLTSVGEVLAVMLPPA